MKNCLKKCIILSVVLVLLPQCKENRITQYEGWDLVWNDEFDYEGAPDPERWIFENGFVRNEELQWYQDDNAQCGDGLLVIEGRSERVRNTSYDPESGDWRKSREYADYTSSCIKTKGKFEFLYGRLEVCARIPASGGSWPAIWTLGSAKPWPDCGEIDVMEYYPIDGKPHILANTACGSDTDKAKWNTGAIPLSHFTDKDSEWTSKFHVWRMDWDEQSIKLYLYGELLNETKLSDTFNGKRGDFINPFMTPQYILLNLAMGSNGGEIDRSALPMKYEIDYVRVYRKK